MRTECQFLGNEISFRVFDLLFFLHSSIVSPSSPSEELRNHVYFKRKKHRNSPSLRGDFCWRRFRGEVLSKILSSDLRDIFFHSTIVY